MYDNAFPTDPEIEIFDVNRPRGVNSVYVFHAIGTESAIISN